MSSILNFVGRLCFVGIFLGACADHVQHFESFSGYAGSLTLKAIPQFQQLPAVYMQAFLYAGLAAAILGAILVLLNQVRVGGFLLALFLAVSTFIAHDPTADQINQIMFMKNLSMFGTCLMLMSTSSSKQSKEKTQ